MARTFPRWMLVAVAAGCSLLLAAGEKLTDDERIELIRGLTAEYATAKTALPRSKKNLVVDTKGNYDKSAWADAARQWGPAARVGDQVKVSKVDIEDDRIVLEINGGFNPNKKKWWEHIQIGMGGSTQPISQGQPQTNAPGGTTIALKFDGPVPAKPDVIKKMLAPILDFEKRTATESYIETLPPEIQAAVKEKRAVVGMDRDQVLLAMGRPVRKVREYKDGNETEDWVYGQPPGKITFVTFAANKVIKVKEDYAGLGSEAPRTAPPL